KVYGTADPALTYQITSGALVNGDTLSGALTRATGAHVGSYAIQQGTVAASANYNLTYIGANLSITPAPLTIAADPKAKIYGDLDPALTYHISSGALISGDSLSGALSRAPGENADVYAIQQGSVSASTDYTLSYLPANLTIGKKDLLAQAD